MKSLQSQMLTETDFKSCLSFIIELLIQIGSSSLSLRMPLIYRPLDQSKYIVTEWHFYLKLVRRTFKSDFNHLDKNFSVRSLQIDTIDKSIFQ